MKFTLAWLKEHLDTEQPLAAIVDKLTMIGLEVESVTDRGKLLAPFTIASVISAEEHPNADRLCVCMVDTGEGGEGLAGVGHALDLEAEVGQGEGDLLERRGRVEVLLEPGEGELHRASCGLRSGRFRPSGR